MSLESRNDKAQLPTVDQVIDIMVTAKSDLESERAENEISKKQLASSINHKKLMQQYEELERQNERLSSENSALSSALESHHLLNSHAQALILKLTQERDSIAQELKLKTIELESTRQIIPR